ncbi:MAG: hypothetical protein OXS30_00960 [Chloroflexota bacterium]|nr:hypothetical protein [Chloroflexota bacterium]
MKTYFPVAATSTALALVVLLLTVRADELAAESGGTVTTTLFPGWNLIGWVEQETHLDRLFDQIPQVVVIHRDDGHSVSRFSDLAFDQFEALTPGRGYWFRVESQGPVEWTRPAQPVSRKVAAPVGDRLIAWTGRDGIEIAEALSGIEDHLSSAWKWDASSQSFSLWAPIPGLPDWEARVGYGDGVLVRLSRSIDWLQPSGLLPEIVAPVDLPDSNLQIIQRDIRAVESIFATRFHAPIDQTRVSFFIQGSRHWDPYIPCCAPETGWPERSIDAQGDARYRFSIPLTAWTGQGRSRDASDPSYGYQQLLKYYFRILQHEYAGDAIDAVPRWLILGTTAQISELAGRRPRYSPNDEFGTNRITLPTTPASTPEDDTLGRVYVSKLVSESTRDSYFRFWSLMDRTSPSQDAWKNSFRLAFGVDADEFVRQTNRERRSAFTTVTGKLIWEGEAEPSVLRIRGWYLDDYSRGPLHGTVLGDGSYRIELPRDHRYRMQVNLPVAGCSAHVGSDGRLSAHRNPEILEAVGRRDQGPNIIVPAEFCHRAIHLRVAGPGVEEIPDLELLRCTADGQTCSYWRSSLVDDAPSHRSRVPLPGKYVFKIRGSAQSCSAYLAEAGVTPNLADALLIEATDLPVETVVELPAGIQLCSHTLRGQLTGKPAGWYEGRRVRLSPRNGGASANAILDGEGRFEARLSLPGNHILSVSVSRPTDQGLLSCSVTSEQEHQWLRRVSDPPQTDEDYVAVSAEGDSELHWQIGPHACDLVVSGRAQTPDGEPLAWTDLIVCPDGGGLCTTFQTDESGRFQYLADNSWRYYVTTRSAWGASGLCQQAHRAAATTYFTVRPDSENRFTWTFPPSPCD